MNSPDKALEIKAAITAVVAIVTSLLGWTGIAVVILLICIVLDYITGSFAAKAHGEWSSKIAREGLWHKLGEIIAICVAALCDIALHVVFSSAAANLFSNMEIRGWFTLIVAIWYIFTELGSILENVAKLGAPVPKWLIEGIGKLKHRVDKKEAVEDHEEEKPEEEEPKDDDTQD